MKSTKHKQGISTGLTVAIIVIVVVIVAAGVLYYYSTSTTPATTVTFGIPVKASYQFMPIYYAANNSYFSKNGLNVTIQAGTGDASLSTAISNGEVSIGMDNVFSVEHFIQAGLPLKIVAQVTSVNDFVIIQGNKTNYRSPSAMNNAKIGVTSVPGLTDALASNFGKNNSITVTPVPLGGLSGQVAGLTQNNTQAFVWTFEEGYNLGILHQGSIVANLSSYYPQWKTEMVIFATTSMIQNQPSVVKNVLKSIFQALNGIKNSQGQAATFLQNFENLQPAAATESIARAVTLYSYDGTIDPTGIAYGISFAVSSGIIPTGSTVPNATSTYTTQFTPVSIT